MLRSICLASTPDEHWFTRLHSHRTFAQGDVVFAPAVVLVIACVCAASSRRLCATGRPHECEAAMEGQAAALETGNSYEKNAAFPQSACEEVLCVPFNVAETQPFLLSPSLSQNLACVFAQEGVCGEWLQVFALSLLMLMRCRLLRQRRRASQSKASVLIASLRP
jgi:hypothetical protein